METKTAMQELIEWIGTKILLSPRETQEKATELLEKEKEQISNAFNYALKMRFGSESQINTGENYFTETYNS